MEDFKDKFQKQIQDFITHHLEKENAPSTDQMETLAAVSEVLLGCAGSILSLEGKTLKTHPLPDSKLAILQVVPESLYIEANKTLDEHIARKNKNKETMH